VPKIGSCAETALVQRADDRFDVASDVLGDDSVRYLVMRLLGGGFRPGNPSPYELLTTKGALLLEAARNSCSRDLIPVVREHGITASNAFSVKPERPAREYRMYQDASSRRATSSGFTSPSLATTSRRNIQISARFDPKQRLQTRADALFQPCHSLTGHTVGSPSGIH
jgi:hypothetical protein